MLGQFRTGILDQSRKHDALNTEQGISEYAAIKTEMADRHATTHGMQPGDPDVAVERMVDIVRTQSLGVKAVETPPLRIPLGSDAVQVMRAKCQDTLDLLDAWEYFACSTDFPDKMEIPSYSR